MPVLLDQRWLVFYGCSLLCPVLWFCQRVEMVVSILRTETVNNKLRIHRLLLFSLKKIFFSMGVVIISCLVFNKIAGMYSCIMTVNVA